MSASNFTCLFGWLVVNSPAESAKLRVRMYLSAFMQNWTQVLDCAEKCTYEILHTPQCHPVKHQFMRGQVQQIWLLIVRVDLRTRLAVVQATILHADAILAWITLMTTPFVTGSI